MRYYYHDSSNHESSKTSSASFIHEKEEVISYTPSRDVPYKCYRIVGGKRNGVTFCFFDINNNGYTLRIYRHEVEIFYQDIYCWKKHIPMKSKK